MWGDSIGHYNSVYIEMVVAIFIILFGVNFNLYYYIILKKFSLAYKNEEVRTYFGRVRKLPEFASRKFMERELAKRLAMNTPIQGTAADIIKIAMNSVSAELRRRNLESKLILQIHDELIVEGPVNEVEEVENILEQCMMGAADLAVDLVCDIHTGKTWYELK